MYTISSSFTFTITVRSAVSTTSASVSASPLGPIDPTSIAHSSCTSHNHEAAAEEEKAAPWIVRKLVGSMTGRIVMSSYETLRAAGTNVICLSPWGDSSPLFLPCIRFRDLAVHTMIAATGGMAAVAAPVMGPVSDAVVGSFGDTILVELGLSTGFAASTKIANDLVFDKTLKKIIPIHSARLETTGVKVLLITLMYKHTVSDAALGFYRSSLHSDASLFSAVKDYLAVEKGWFSPYLFASARRPVIPRSMKPDIVFCHGPFLSGDYSVGATLVKESASIIALCDAPEPPVETTHPEAPRAEPSLLENVHARLKHMQVPSLSNIFARSRTPSPEPALTPVPAPPVPRRMVMLVVGLKPHRKAWSLSARPGESVLNYVLLNGCPAVVVPVKPGAPLVAWDCLTLEQLWEVDLPPTDDVAARSASGRYEGICDVLFEYLDFCIDWTRVTMGGEALGMDTVARKESAEGEAAEMTTANSDVARKAVKDAVHLLVAAAIRSKESKEARKEVDADRSGIAMWRIP